MLDKIFVRNNIGKDVFTPDYTSDQAVVSRKLVNVAGANLYVLFPPWHGGGSVYEKLIQRIARTGNAALAYYLHDEILKPSSDHVVASFERVSDTVAGDLHTLSGTSRYNRINLVAMSLGNPALSMVTSKFSQFDSATVVDGASSLARSMWHGARTQHIRAGIEREGHNLSSLEQAWTNLAPIHHVDALSGKNVRIVVSKTDEIIPTRYQEEFVDAVQAAGIDPIVQRTRLGHYASIARYCLSGELYT